MAKFVVWLLLILTLCNFLDIEIAGLSSDSYACLKVETTTEEGFSQYLIDVGSRRLFLRTLPIPPLAAQNKGKILSFQRSPDAKWVAYRESYSKEAVSAMYASLYVRSIRGTAVGTPIVLKVDIPVPASEIFMFWSPDSKHLFYQWAEYTGQSTFEIISPDGKTRFSKIGSALQNGWSADGNWLAVHTADLPDALQFWSSAEGQFVAPSETDQVYQNNTDALQFGSWQWSPQGHTFAYVNRDKLMLFTPGQKDQITFDLQEKLSRPSIEWSPDGNYLALLNYTNDSWQLNIFGKDGTTLQHVSDKVAVYWDDSPNVFWRPDGKSLLYMENTAPNEDAYKGQLVKYDLDTQHINILGNGLNSTSPVHQTDHYALVEGLEGNEPIWGAVSLADSSRRQLATYAEAYWISPDEKVVAILSAPSKNPQLRLQTMEGFTEHSFPVEIWSSWDLFWAPDSSKLVTAEIAVGGTDVEIDVYSVDGQWLYQTIIKSTILPDISWQRCSEM